MAAADTHLDRSRRRWAWFLQVFGILLLIWFALNGIDGVWVGLIAALAGAGLGSWLAPEAPYPWHPLRWLHFALFFLWESLKGGVDVAIRALHPRLLIDPVFVDHRIGLPEGKPTTLLVSFVSLLPGTLSVELHEQRHCLVVHALAPDSVASIDRLEAALALIFSNGHRS